MFNEDFIKTIQNLEIKHKQLLEEADKVKQQRKQMIDEYKQQNNSFKLNEIVLINLTSRLIVGYVAEVFIKGEETRYCINALLEDFNIKNLPICLKKAAREEDLIKLEAITKLNNKEKNL